MQAIYAYWFCAILIAHDLLINRPWDSSVPMATKQEIALQSAAQASAALASDLKEKLDAAKQRARSLSKQVEEVRKDPYLNAGIGAVAAAGGGAAAAIANEVVGDAIFKFGGDASGAGAMEVRAGLIFALGATVLGVSEQSSTLLDLGKGALGYEVGSMVAQQVKGAFK